LLFNIINLAEQVMLKGFYSRRSAHRVCSE